jgi:terminal uridylyltransferase
VENFDIFKKNLQIYLKSQTWSVTNAEDLGSLWLQLLAFFSIDFGFKKNFISIRSLTRVSKSEVKMYTKKMAIEDPFLLKQSLSRNLMTQTNKHIIYVISKACLYFVNTTRSLKGSEKDSNLSN